MSADWSPSGLKNGLFCGSASSTCKAEREGRRVMRPPLPLALAPLLFAIESTPQNEAMKWCCNTSGCVHMHTTT